MIVEMTLLWMSRTSLIQMNTSVSRTMDVRMLLLGVMNAMMPMAMLMKMVTRIVEK